MNETPKPTLTSLPAQQLSSSATRASDIERERIAKIISEAAGEGRLTLAEAEERLERNYAATYRDELEAFVADLPAGQQGSLRVPRTGRGIPTRLVIHAVIAVLLSVLLITRWIVSEVPYFWPAGPMFLLFASLAIHARFLWANRYPWRNKPSLPFRQPSSQS